MSRDPTSSALPKSILRTQAHARRAQLAAATPDFAARITAFVEALEFAPGAIIAGYRALKDEADPVLLMRGLAARGHALALPRIAAKDCALHFHRWREGDVLHDNHHGIAEPSADAERLTPDIILVPLLAFDVTGHRLGYGGGYYDRTIFFGPRCDGVASDSAATGGIAARAQFNRRRLRRSTDTLASARAP